MDVQHDPLDAVPAACARRRATSPSEDDGDVTQNAATPSTTLAGFLAWQAKVVETFGRPFLTLVGMVYFVQGFGSFSMLAIAYLMKDVLKLQPAASQAIMTTAGFPWAIKPLYGILSDSLPLCGYRRKSYLVLISILGLCAYFWLHLTTPATALTQITLLILLASLGTAVSDVIIDALVVEMSRLDPKNGANDLQSITWCMMSLGGIVGSLLAGPITTSFGPSRVFLVSMAGPAIILVLSLLMKETKIQAQRHGPSCLRLASTQVGLLRQAMRVPVIWKAALYMFASGAVAPSFSQIQFYFVTEVLHFSPDFMGNVQALGYVFLMVGTVVYNTYCKDLPFRRSFATAQIGLGAISVLEIVLVTRTNLHLGIPDKWFVIGDAMLSDIISRLKMMPLLVLSSKLCPRGIEGTFFALLMAVANLSGAVSGYWGATLCTLLGIGRDAYDNLWIAVLLRSALKLVPLMFLFLLPEHDPQEEVEAMALAAATSHHRELSMTADVDNDDDIVDDEITDLLAAKQEQDKP
ncbi:hypothetical protein SPRG_12973 [Saprolegnia parasitica CBS 223.65]|uniref:Major facilitator superfamily (MFS) profile domain-containing protein n=1 Tax=Saprolegnia parasitica (strain CBS 223.65) TaxID=695850 RepID=A0A067C234_SAPPC|nr:hypothetical protein SPRG_12973 [Saprolegnia parasitica CBS 223.65]KDO20616.1 hypothetical protein SPRG_12973 [Saprolegnia parasitica CBS 223.65]|eukprot:XP_012208671.1 hypothetical protein SPRG_12973 [Saprolegnia parasitica CBS 223.65]